jgi:mannan endo-1,6-alpha-mannosidase
MTDADAEKTDGSEAWAKQTRDFMNASSVFTKDDVLFEICEPKGMCTIQTRAFKSGAIRSYARAGLVAPFIADSVKTLIQASAKGAAGNCETTNENNVKDVKCGLEWNTANRNQKNASNGNLGEVTNALSVIKALLRYDIKPVTPGTPSSGSNSTSSDNSSSTSGAAASEHTGGSGTIAASATSALLIAFVAALTL